MRTSILDYLLENADNHSDVAFRARPKLRVRSWTYAELGRTVFQFARELEKRGIGSGDRVVIWAENSVEWVAAFYGIVLSGAIAVPLDEQSSVDFASQIIEQTNPKLILYGQDITCTIDLPKIDLTDLKDIVSANSADRFYPRETTPTDTVEIVFTSGTTADPKGVVITHENLLANLEPIEREIKKYLKWKFVVDPLKIVCTLPLSHVFGQTIGIFIPQIIKATVVFQNNLSPSELVETVKRE